MTSLTFISALTVEPTFTATLACFPSSIWSRGSNRIRSRRQIYDWGLPAPCLTEFRRSSPTFQCQFLHFYLLGLLGNVPLRGLQQMVSATQR